MRTLTGVQANNCSTWGSWQVLVCIALETSHLVADASAAAQFAGHTNTINPGPATGRPLLGRNAGEMAGIGCLLNQDEADGMALRC